MIEILANPEELVVYRMQLLRLPKRLEDCFANFKLHPSAPALKTLESGIQLALRQSSLMVAESAFHEGFKHSGADKLDGAKMVAVRRDAIASSDLAAKQITGATARAFDLPYMEAMGKKYALSETRTQRITKHQMRMNFYRGIRYGWGLSVRNRKRWILSDAHDRDDICDENVEDGAVWIDDVFSSGDYEPPAHINCGCGMMLVRW